MNRATVNIASRFYYISSFLITIWVIGLAVFYINIPKTSIENFEQIDAVVILTGGAMRLDAGFDAFTKTNAKKILISGVGQGVQKKDILNTLKTNYQINTSDIILGELAKSTDDNAIETKAFMNLNQYKSLLLVTSNYHMPRSVFIFWAAMPDFTIQKLAVDNQTNLEDYRIKLIVNEYNKLLGSILLYIYNQASDLYISAIYNAAEIWNNITKTV